MENYKLGLAYFKNNKINPEEFNKISPIRNFEQDGYVVETIDTIESINHSIYVIVSHENREYKLFLTYLKKQNQ